MILNYLGKGLFHECQDLVGKTPCNAQFCIVAMERQCLK